ncbi:MAG: type II toxin-antitoxin system VapC family toxin [Tepidisphaeraceae bacterium]|jgi:predicted nucleic acid-binding protein
MPRIIIDASTTLAWLFDEDASAAHVGNVLEASDLVAPWLWRLEVTNAILVRQRRKLLTEAQSFRLLYLIDELAIDLIGEPATRTATRLAETARPHQLSAYDAVYLDLAVRLGLPLFTRDNNLRAAATRIGVKLITQGK